MSLTSLYPRGNPLTEAMPFTASDGVVWLAYIEGGPAPGGPWHVALPGRRLRFDSIADSRAIGELPAGSPFLPPERLRDLLERTHPVPLCGNADWRPDELPAEPPAPLSWLTGVAEHGAAVREDWSRRWRQGARRRLVLRERARRLLLSAIASMVTRVQELGHRLRAAHRPHHLRPR